MTPLPIDDHLPHLVETARRERLLVLQAEPGAGKTTRLPPAIADALPDDAGAVIVLEPRRLAARLAARHVARTLGEEPGGRVGWQVRHESKRGPRTRVLYVTEGILLRRLVREPTLPGIAAVVLDEFHERHLETDVALALLLELRRARRPDLALIVMSATLEAERIGAFLEAPVAQVPGRAFPVDVEHEARLEVDAIERRVARAVDAIHDAPEPTGDVLVFLPGAAEIRRATNACAELARRRGLDVVPLHGSLPLAEQDRAVRPGPRKKVILATNVAESSVTVEGVTAVVDAGLERRAVDDPWSGVRELEVAPISRASAAQRAGRAGRLGPGRCVRLYTARDHDGRPAATPPEVARLDLAEPALLLAALGVADPRTVRWLDPPPPAALTAATTLLRRLGAVDAAGAPTPIGRRMLGFPLPPRLARVVVAGVDLGAPQLVATAAALLSERDLRRRAPRTGRGDDARAEAAWRAAAGDARSDVIALATLLEDARRARFAPRATREVGLGADAARSVDRVRAQIERLARPDAGEPIHEPADDADEALARALLAGFPDRVARRRSAGSPGLTVADGTAATLGRESVVADAEWLLVLDAHRSRRGPGGAGGDVICRTASAIDPDWLFDVGDGVRDDIEVAWDCRRRRATATERLVYGALVLDEQVARGDAAAEAIERRLAKEALAAGPEAFCEGDALAQLIERAALAREADPSIPPLGLDDAREALAQLCAGRSSFEQLLEADLVGVLRGRLGAALARLDHVTPETVVLPGGRRLRVRYEPGKPPWASSRLQDFFGMTDGPRAGAEPLVLHLLAPNQRPVQITTDLAGFWERHYPAIRRELKRKYPKHDWPEDPRTAKPPPPGGRKRR